MAGVGLPGVYDHPDLAWFFFFTKTPLQAAKTEYHTFSSLVRVLVKYCTSELDKARAIFRLKKELTNV